LETWSALYTLNLSQSEPQQTSEAVVGVEAVRGGTVHMILLCFLSDDHDNLTDSYLVHLTFIERVERTTTFGFFFKKKRF